jgi:prolyl 3-hydroxylase /prolyl 3,4-dihydroxylase
MKRKTGSRGQQSSIDPPQAKKRALSNDVTITHFREGLFDQTELEKFTKNYAESAP